MDNVEINDLLSNGFENTYMDFKLKQYPSKNPAFIKDVISMANSHSKRNKFIFFGVNDHGEILGLDREENLVDSATLQEIILEYIEPDITIDYFPYDYDGKKIGVLKISKDNDNRPYLVKKELKPLRKGNCFLRKGSMNTVASREDFDAFYREDERFELSIMDPTVRAADDRNARAFMSVSIRNFTSRPVTLVSGELQITNDENDIYVSLPVYGLEEDKGADFTFYAEANSEKVGDLYLGMTSSHCVKLNLDEHGVTENDFTFTLKFWDSQGNEYSQFATNGQVFARGEFIWKVIARKKS